MPLASLTGECAKNMPELCPGTVGNYAQNFSFSGIPIFI